MAKTVPAKPPRLGGRPPRSEAGLIKERILDIATQLFLTEGYGATSIEAVAKQAGISKRTFYHRFDDKAGLFAAAVHRLIMRLRPARSAPLFQDGTLEEILQRLGKIILRAALAPEALALHRLIISEGVRFPELAAIMDAEGSRREAVTRIVALLKEKSTLHPGSRISENIALENSQFAAEQFLQMVVSVPQRRALGLGSAMTADELDTWAEKAVNLFLKGIGRFEG